MVFDTHAHYDDEAFDSDREQLISRLQQEGIKYVVNVAANMKSSRNNLELINAQIYSCFVMKDIFVMVLL